MANNIVLIGFMGAGKDTVGRILASKTNRQLISTDELIEISEGRMISDIFGCKGEKYFRDKESAVLRVIQELPNLIIATGGGMVIREQNRQRLQKMGKVVHLDAPISRLFARSGIDGKRPLAKNKSFFTELYKQRRKLYNFCDFRIDASHKTPSEIANLIIKKFNLPKTITRTAVKKRMVNAESKKYGVLIGNSILTQALKIIPAAKRIAIVSNPLISSLYRSRLMQGLSKRNSLIHEYILPDGEKYKNINHAQKIYHYLLKNNFDRSDLIIALGGGVISDLAGFVASTYKRGIKFVIIPTTLLGQVDAGIGGKTGIDLAVKNSIGTFYQPELVIIDIDFIQTLCPKHFNNGLAEVIKCAAIADPALFSLLEQNIDRIKHRDPIILEKMISRCVMIKGKIVEQDEREESGQRLILNFGHTIGHAIERLSNYRIDHGAAVAIGMVQEARMANRLGYLSDKDQQRLNALISNYGLPVSQTKKMKIADLEQSLKQDKKIRKSTLSLPLLSGIGRVKIKEVAWEKLLSSMVQI